MEMPKFGEKMPWLGIFGLEFQETIFEISTLKFVKNKFLIHAMKFDIGSAFSRGPGSAFSKGPCPDLGLPYKVC